MNIDEKRLMNNLKALRIFTDTPGDGVTRFSYGVQDLRARQYLTDLAKAGGCTVRQDPVGNLRIGLPSNVPGRRTILCGSHIDTVRNGGWLDGIYGVCSALEVLLTLAAEEDADACSGEVLPSAEPGIEATESIGSKAAGNAPLNYEMVIFAEEEGSNFGSTMTGSKFLTGKYGEADLDKLTADDGRSLRQVLADWQASMTERMATDMQGAADEEPIATHAASWDLSDVAAMLELHIEQGPVLEWAGRSIGIVEAIFGMRVIEVTLQGVGNHAGATPMKERCDALTAAAECILAAETIVKGDPEERTVVTIGKLDLQPNCSNVIPETVRFSLEVRDKDRDEIDGNMDRIIDRIQEIAAKRGVDCRVREHSSSQPLELDAGLADTIAAAAEAMGLPHQRMDSGAVHDACMIAETGVPTGMIFVPSIGGRSHVPEEDTREEDLLAGAQLLLDVVERLRSGQFL